MPIAEFVATNNVAGAALWPQSPADETTLTRLRAAVPLVLIDRRVLGFEADSVGFDDVVGGHLATEHLLAQGHRRIGFLGDEAFAETVQYRWRDYTLAPEAAGIPFDLSCVALFQGMQEPLTYDYLRLFLAGGGLPLRGIVCSNDTAVLYLLRFLRCEGYRIPDDVVVTGYGNPLSDYLDHWNLPRMMTRSEQAPRYLLVRRPESRLLNGAS